MLKEVLIGVVIDLKMKMLVLFECAGLVDVEVQNGDDMCYSSTIKEVYKRMPEGSAMTLNVDEDEIHRG